MSTDADDTIHVRALNSPTARKSMCETTSGQDYNGKSSFSTITTDDPYHAGSET